MVDTKVGEDVHQYGNLKQAQKSEKGTQKAHYLLYHKQMCNN